jgi:hypothetical protein
MTPRDQCTYEYISDTFNPQTYGYMVSYIGFCVYFHCENKEITTMYIRQKYYVYFTVNIWIFQAAMTGFDPYGYPYQRILPTVAFDSAVSCANGGVKSPTENRCVCPPAYGGKGKEPSVKTL